MIVISLLSPLLALIMMLAFCLKNFKKSIANNLKQYSIPLGIIFGSFGYSFSVISKHNDLLTYYGQIDALSGHTLGDVIASDSEGLYIRDFLFYLLNKSGEKYILPFIVGFIIYTIVFYVLFDLLSWTKRAYSYGEALMLAIVSVGILSPYTVICNTRCVLAFILIAFAVYRDTVQNKKNIQTIILYVLPIFLHTAAISIIFIRLLSIVICKFNKAKWAVLLMIFLFPTIIDVLHANIAGHLGGAIGNIVSSAINKAYWYLHWTSGGWASQVDSSISSKLTKIFGTVIIIVFMYILLKGRKANEKEKKYSIINEPMGAFLFAVSVIALGCLHIKTGAFWRFEAIVVLFSPYIIISGIDNKIIKRSLFWIIAIYSVILLIYNLFYLKSNLSMTPMLINYLVAPGVRAIFYIMNGIISLIGG